MMRHGGTRPGAGRKKGIVVQAVARSSAADILARINDDETWLWLVKTARKKGDTRTVLEALKYLTDRRDGKAPQAIKLEPEDKVTFGLGSIAEKIMAEQMAARENRSAPGTLEENTKVCPSSANASAEKATHSGTLNPAGFSVGKLSLTARRESPCDPLLKHAINQSQGL